MSENDASIYCGDEDTRRWLKSYITKYPHHTTAILSRSEFIGVSRIALDAYLAGTYFFPKEDGGQGADPENSTIEDSIRAYRLRVEGTKQQELADDFIETRTYKQLRQACSIAINENKIVLVYGTPGIGKSRGLAEFSKREMTTSPITILCSGNITWYYFVEMIADRMGLDKQVKTVKLEDLIAEKLKLTPRTLFIDQANYLNDKGLATICHIWEKAKNPISLFGTKDLFNLFMSSRLTEDVRAQLTSRVGYHFMLAGLTLAETKEIVLRALKEDATDPAISQIFNITRGIIRYVKEILPRIVSLKEFNRKKLTRGEITMKDIIKIAGSRLIIDE